MTKTLLIAVLAILLSGTAAFAQTAEKPAKAGEIEALSQKWMEAARDHDMKTLQELLADDFKLVRASKEKPITRAEWLQGLATLDTKQFRYEYLKVSHHGPMVAVANGVFVAEIVVDNHTVTPVAAITDVWEKRNGKWQIVTRYTARPEELRLTIAQTLPAVP